MVHNLLETRDADYEPYFSERALTSLLHLSSNYPTTQPLTCPFLIAQSNGIETATNDNQLEQITWLIFSRILALLPWQQAISIT
jgi:hypothetical protein